MDSNPPSNVMLMQTTTFLQNTVTGWPPSWKTWKSKGIWQWSGKSQGD